MSDQDKRVAVVTGATSGIGLAVARLLATQDHKVFIGARSAENVAETVKVLQGEGLEVDGASVDVRSGEGVRGWIQAAVDRFGGVDVVVNNAGRSGGGVTADIDDE
ncbi:SDR family NAD(P)-dependent oxidoreductase, partial [Streptomyces racemochromogenes]